jgi:hypothetical protein
VIRRSQALIRDAIRCGLARPFFMAAVRKKATSKPTWVCAHEHVRADEAKACADEHVNARNKHKAVRINDGGRCWDSGAEHAHWQELKLREAAHDITGLEIQPKVDLVLWNYKPDFSYVETKTGRRVWVDVKGKSDREWSRTKRVWGLFGPGVLLEVKRAGRKRGFQVTETIPGAASPDPRALIVNLGKALRDLGTHLGGCGYWEDKPYHECDCDVPELLRLCAAWEGK